MKKIILTLLLAGTLAAGAFAQCDQKIVINSSKTEHRDEKGELTRTVDENAEVQIDKANFTVAINGEQRISGNVKSITCDWKTPFKEGKSVIKATASNQNGDEKDVTITIEGKDGKVYLNFDIADEPGDKVRITADKFEAKS